jgi:hypothetical protein
LADIDDGEVERHWQRTMPRCLVLKVIDPPTDDFACVHSVEFEKARRRHERRPQLRLSFGKRQKQFEAHAV